MVIVSGLVGAILSALIAIYVSLLGRNSSLDSSSKWREGLLNVASKYQLTKDDAQRVRSSLRMFKHDNKEIVVFSFDWFTNIMITELEKILSGPCQKCNMCNKEDFLESDDIKVVRLFANFLLKYHYEYQSEMGPNQLILGKKKRNNQENDLVKETFEELWKIRNQIVKGFNDE